MNPGAVTRIALAAIAPSLTNPRKRFDEAKLAELERELAAAIERNVAIINRRVAVEQILIDAGNGKRLPPTREECRKLAQALGGVINVRELELALAAAPEQTPDWP